MVSNLAEVEGFREMPYKREPHQRRACLHLS